MYSFRNLNFFNIQPNYKRFISFLGLGLIFYFYFSFSLIRPYIFLRVCHSRFCFVRLVCFINFFIIYVFLLLIYIVILVSTIIFKISYFNFMFKIPSCFICACMFQFQDALVIDIRFIFQLYVIPILFEISSIFLLGWSVSYFFCGASIFLNCNMDYFLTFKSWKYAHFILLC